MYTELFPNVDAGLMMTHPKATHLGGNIHGGDPRSYTETLWTWLLNNYDVGSMLDVGCGEGHTAKWFREHNVRAIGCEGLPYNVNQCAINDVPCVFADITKTAVVLPVPPDLVWCCEVVEHIAEEHLDNLLRTLTQGRMLAMTHALPDQDGYHHVNCQPQEYWIAHVETWGLTFQRAATERARVLAGSPDMVWFARSGLIFTR